MWRYLACVMVCKHSRSYLRLKNCRVCEQTIGTRSSLCCSVPEALPWSRGCCEATSLAQVETPIIHISVTVVKWEREAGKEFDM